jgi:sialic acid synthase SpsE
MDKVKIGEKFIGEGEPTYLVAEIGINHNGDVNLAKEMIDAAKKCGVDAVKFQVFKAEEFVSDDACTYTYRSQGKEITEPMIEMFRRYEFTRGDWIEIFGYCQQKNIDFFVTPQNPSDLDLILYISDLPAIKVGADDLTNLELLEYYASKNIPIIISAGMAYISEIEDAVRVIQNAGNKDLIILHCISSYPTKAEEVNLRKMSTIRQAFDVIVGFSDHTIGPIAAVGAVVMGANLIEKHFTLDKNLPGPDHWFSADTNELHELVRQIRYVEKIMGSSVVKPTANEIEMRKLARRSIVASRDILKDETLKRDMVSFGRPGTGLPPKYVKYILNKKANVKIRKNEKITFKKVC